MYVPSSRDSSLLDAVSRPISPTNQSFAESALSQGKGGGGGGGGGIGIQRPECAIHCLCTARRHTSHL